MRELPNTYRSGESAPAAKGQIETLLTQYVQAWETADVSRLAALLRDDAVLTMPPIPAWYQGREAIEVFLQRHLFAGSSAGTFRVVATRANGCPAFGVFHRREDGVYQPGALQVLELDGDRISAMHCFLPLDDRLFARFGLAVTP
jgi:RNA polymerase sigma-70 factor (ECF subfamily)